MKKRIIFDKWKDPFKISIDKLPDATSLDDDEDEDISDYLKEEQDKYNDETEHGQNFKHLSKPIKILSGPAGILPLSEEAYPGVNFNLHIAHCNFIITPKITNQLEQLEGIEILRILTNYRFLFAVGLAFKESEVKANIIRLLCVSDELEHARLLLQPALDVNEELTEELQISVNTMLNASNYKYTMIYVFPNGQFYTTVSNEITTEFLNDIEKYSIIQNHVGGVIVTNLF